MKQKKTVSILLTAAILAASFSPGGGGVFLWRTSH